MIRLPTTHITHCCFMHGCKYGNPACPVANGSAPQTYPCEECSDVSDPANLEDAYLMNEMYDAGMERAHARYGKFLHKAARLARVLRDKIDGLPDHPWIPGLHFKDGQLMDALENVEREVRY